MAVVIETTIGDFTVDLFVQSRPQECKNFLKLCKMKYYNFCLFHYVQPNFLAQTGDPSGTGNGGESIYGLLYGENVRYFEAEVMPKLRHDKPGLLSMVNVGSNMLGSQFIITLGEDLQSLDKEHCVFGEVAEGTDIILRLNEAICDSTNRPYKDIRITHTIILEDPFDDPSGLIAPDMSPEATQERLANGRIGADEEIDDTAGLTAAQVEELKQEREAKARATILEIVGDLPDAEMAPPENVLFVCKLNPVTSDDDLEIIFSRFGKVKSCEVIRDKNTGDSLQYAFVEFEDQKSCEEAYFKMDNVLIDDRRIHVDFSQSVAKMRWRGKGRGVDYFDNKDQSRDLKSSSHRDESRNRSSNRRDRDHEDRDRRRDRGRDKEDDRYARERGKDKESDDRYRRRDERDRSKSDWRKRDSKHRKDDYRDDDKRYDIKRRERDDGSRKKDDDSKRHSSSKDKKMDERRSDDKRIDERKRDKESKEINGKSNSRQTEFDKSGSSEKLEIREKSTEKFEIKEIKEKDKGRSSKYSSPVLHISKEETLSDSFHDSRELPPAADEVDKSLGMSIPTDVPKPNVTVREVENVRQIPSKDEKKQEEEAKKEKAEIENIAENNTSQKNDIRIEEIKKPDNKKKAVKRKQSVSDNRKRKKRYHSSSSESSSESSDSSDSSSSSDSSDHRHSKKKKLIVAKRYYRGGKLVKEIKKKKRTKDTSDSESVTDESSDSDPKRKRKQKKTKKVINIYKQPRRKSLHSSEDSQSESSSSEDSDVKDKKKKRKVIDKYSKKKSKMSSKRRSKRKETSSSSDSEGSVRNKAHRKKHKKYVRNSKCNTVATTASE